MGRKFAQIQVAIWSDEDFKALLIAQQHMYFTLLSQPRINLCGVLDYIPSRLSLCSHEMTVEHVETVIDELESERFVVLDRDTQEIMIRSFVRNDGLLRSPTVTKGMAADFAEIMSQRLRDEVENELRRAYREDPDLGGWKGLAEVNPIVFEHVTEGVSK